MKEGQELGRDRPPPVRLADRHLTIFRRVGRIARVTAGTVIYSAGDRTSDFIIVLAGSVDVIHARGSRKERVMNTYRANEFAGEVGLLSGRRISLTAVARTDTTLLRVPLAKLREVVGNDPELSQMILDAFTARRSYLMRHEAGLTIIGSRLDPATRELAEFLSLNRIPMAWIEWERDDEATAALAATGAEPSDLPVAIIPGLAPLAKATPETLRTALGLSGAANDGPSGCDLAVVGAGPAGLAAAVYGASEGLNTALIEATALGGQASTSSRIENYLGFPAGISGDDLTTRASTQIRKFGVRVRYARAVGLSSDAVSHMIALDNGEVVQSRAVIIATGAQYGRLTIPRVEAFEQGGVHYAADALEAQRYLGAVVAVVGGGNAAGQAALHLARTSERVFLIVRRPDLTATMSQYLIDEISREGRIELLPQTEVVELHGDQTLDGVTVLSQDGENRRLAARALFVFIGADPRLGWLRDSLALDKSGFVLTGADLGAIDFDPLPLETSRPGVFAAGDARSGSVKRVASAVGEGSMAVRFVHQHLARQGTERRLSR